MDEGRARLDGRDPAQVLRTSSAPMPVGRRHVGDLLRRHLLHQAHRRVRSTSGTSCPTRSRTPTRSSASPRPSASTSPASPPSTSPRSSSTATVRTSSAQGVIFCDMDTALREYPELVKQYFGTIIPPNDNKFAALNSAVWSRRLVHLRAAGRERRDAAAGLLPHQRREHGPVRAHADHRRRGLPGALHRGLLGPRVHHRLAALGRGRDRREAVAPGSPTRPSRTGRTTSSTWSPSGPGSRPRATWSGSTATSAAASR